MTIRKQPYHCLDCKLVWDDTPLGKERWEIHKAEYHADPDWRKQAACRGMDTNIFFPTQGAASVREARAVCATCPVTNECFLASNEVFSQRYGVWGGLSSKARKAKRKRLGIASATQVMEEWLFDQRNEPLPIPEDQWAVH